MVPFWISTTGANLAQGDYLPNCLVPIVPAAFGPNSRSADLTIHTVDLVVMTQSCDLANAKNGLVALCSIYPIKAFESVNPAYARKGAWEEVRKGRREGLHLLASPTKPAVGREALIVDFREIFSLPVEYLAQHAVSLGARWRLDSPFLEHFSQAFARFFMRVGLPSAVPPITD
jgi:hypothetical protein